VPVDVGVDHASKPQDMAVERWLESGFNDTQSVIDLSVNFEALIPDVSDGLEEDLEYCLVMETQERHTYVCCPICFNQQPVNNIYRGNIVLLSLENAIIY